MLFRISDSFTDSLAKLTGQEQKAVKQTAFDLQLNPSNPGMSFHKLDRAKDKNFWSVRVGRDIRIIVHRSGNGLLLCYVDHHDSAYDWASRRKIERHPRTGAAQLVEVREKIREIEIPTYVEVHEPLPLLFEHTPREDLLDYGVPEEWMGEVLLANEETLLELADHLPSEAAEALLEIATGSVPSIATVVEDEVDQFEHPDAQRRFRVMTNFEELEAALEFPWEKWITFLHPSQREVVTRDFSGPARISGSAGTGKTIVAIHRAVHLAKKNPGKKVLLTTFSRTLAKSLKNKVDQLIGENNDLKSRLLIRSIDEIGIDAYESVFEKPTVPTEKMIKKLLQDASEKGDEHRFSMQFLEMEWTDVVDAWQLTTWDAYRDVQRLGRKTRLGEKQRAILWKIFSEVRSVLDQGGLVTIPTIFSKVNEEYASGAIQVADFVLVDEAQDINVYQLRFLATVAGDKDNGLFFAGDLGQRIFRTPFSWKALGVEVRGRSSTLRINYRTSHQIRQQADKLLPSSLTDVDGNEESRRGTVSIFNGDKPVVVKAVDVEEEKSIISHWITRQLTDGVEPHEIGIFVRSGNELDRATSAVEEAGASSSILDANTFTKNGYVSISTMHYAKGLEFKAVAVIALDEDILPLQERIDCITDEGDLEDVYETERSLLYVACTRARDNLLLTCVEPGSEFIDDFVA